MDKIIMFFCAVIIIMSLYLGIYSLYLINEINFISIIGGLL